MDRICLDSDFIIDAMHGKKDAASFLLGNEEKAIFAITIISLFELYRGAFGSSEKGDIFAVDNLKNKFEILNLSGESVKMAGEVMAELRKRGDVIDFKDLFIGTIAVVNGFAVKTNNIKHFIKIPNLKLV